MSVTELTPRAMFPDVLQATSGHDAIRQLGMSAYTLFAVPVHDSHHADVARKTEADADLPLAAPVEELIEQVRYDTLERHGVSDLSLPKLSNPALVRLAGVLIQFTDYTPRAHNIKTPYSSIEHLRESVHARAGLTDAPLDLGEQLDIALDQTKGNLPDALWQLFITSRLHARWLDTSIVHGIPDMSREEVVDTMKRWQDSVVAYKERGSEISQDSGGDTYYAWTHALAKLAFTAMPEKPSMATRAGTRIFHHGTSIMHTLVHKLVHSQSVKSDHTVAAMYGNALGQACIDTFTEEVNEVSYDYLEEVAA